MPRASCARLQALGRTDARAPAAAALPTLFVAQGLQLDAEAALEHVLRRPDIDATRVGGLNFSNLVLARGEHVQHAQPTAPLPCKHKPTAQLTPACTRALPRPLPLRRWCCLAGRWAARWRRTLPASTRATSAAWSWKTPSPASWMWCRTRCRCWRRWWAPAGTPACCWCAMARRGGAGTLCSARGQVREGRRCGGLRSMQKLTLYPPHPCRFFNFLVRNRWDSEQRLRQLTALPTLFLSSLAVRCTAAAAALTADAAAVLLLLSC